MSKWFLPEKKKVKLSNKTFSCKFIYIEIPYSEGALESLSFIQLYFFAPSHLLQSSLVNHRKRKVLLFFFFWHKIWGKKESQIVHLFSTDMVA